MTDSALKIQALFLKAINKKHYEHAKKFISNLPENFTVTFHAGALGTKPNTLESIRKALDFGATVVEFDVTFRPDGTAVILHADSAKSDEGVLLNDALAVVASDKNCRINLDIKSTANLAEVDKLVKEHGLFERVFYTGVFDSWVETVKATSAIPYYLNHKLTANEAKDEEKLQKLADEIISLGAIGLNSNLSHATALTTEIMHKNGLLVSLWTANTPAEMAKVIACLPDNLTTKKPHITLDMLK